MSAFTHTPHASPREQELSTSNKKIMHKDGKYYLLPLHQSIAELSPDYRAICYLLKEYVTNSDELIESARLRGRARLLQCPCWIRSAIGSVCRDEPEPPWGWLAVDRCARSPV